MLPIASIASTANCASASVLLQLDPSLLPSILTCRQWSYFSFVPPRFGHVAPLDDAFRCLVTITHSHLVPDHRRSDRVILQSYGKALQSLQQAFSEPNDRHSAEILCATGLLSIFEVSQERFSSLSKDR